ncbi:MAG: dTDP-4-dehydrorhamnose 3,5-epimerase [Pirellulales bacterium]
MKFIPTTIGGAYSIEPERLADERGFFARTWCEREFQEHGLESRLVQCSISYSPERGTLRGIHFQAPPHAEVKLVRCTRGAIYDVILDLRPDSPTRLAWAAFELSAENHNALYIPPGLAHGFLTLADDCEVFYQMSEFFEGSAARGVRWNDPAFGIEWPRPVMVISARDANYPLWQGN